MNYSSDYNELFDDKIVNIYLKPTLIYTQHYDHLFYYLYYHLISIFITFSIGVDGNSLLSVPSFPGYLKHSGG